MQEDGSLTDEFTDMHSVAHGGYMGNFALAFLSQNQVKIGYWVRLRLINVATNRIFHTQISGVHGSLVALDGMALSDPRPTTELVLAPAQRADLIVDIIGPVAFDMVTRQGPYRLADLAVIRTNADRLTRPIMALSKLSLPTPATQASI